MSKHKDWFDEHVIIDFGDFNNKEDKKKADDLKEKLKEKLEEVRTALSDVQQDGKHSAFNTDTIIELLEHTQDRLDFGTAEISSLKDEMVILQNYIGIMSEWMNNAFYVINQTIKHNHDDMKKLVERFFKNYNRIFKIFGL